MTAILCMDEFDQVTRMPGRRRINQHAPKTLGKAAAEVQGIGRDDPFERQLARAVERANQMLLDG